MQKSYNVTMTSSYPLGVRFVPEGLHISAVCEQGAECGILLYDKKHKDGMKIPFPKEYRKGNVFSMLLEGYRDKNCSYLFYQGEKLFQDPYAKALVNERKYGEIKELPSRCKIEERSFDWEDDKSLLIPFEESVFYLLHVRGFTKHKSSGVHAKGTYAGIVEKIPYLKELGITAVLLMPSYEFNEVLPAPQQPSTMEQAMMTACKPIEDVGNTSVRINYWGYQEGLYFLPKYAYAYAKDAVTEFKDMVKALHQSGIEVMMQFYFPPGVDHMKILEILRYWVLEYHIDGFHLMGIDIPMHMISREPLFAETKLLGEEKIREERNVRFRNFGLMNEAFLYDMRKLLKGDADMINSLIRFSKENDAAMGVVNYIAKQDGFRLYDLVSYDKKHNEENGEQNEDGNAYNCSWNCGVEGKTRKKNILTLRMRQMKNAMTFVMLSQGTPLLYSGDEFGNSQNGNNNPYCQDNSVCWIKWNLLKSNEALYTYTRDLISFRKDHAILHAGIPLRGIDYISCGYPDISYHGREAWKPDTGPESRSIGILYCGLYGKQTDNMDESFVYIGINMHWETHEFGLPQIAKDKEWIQLFSTEGQETANKAEEEKKTTEEPENIYKVVIPPRTITVYGTRQCRITEQDGFRKRRREPLKKKGKES